MTGNVRTMLELGYLTMNIVTDRDPLDPGIFNSSTGFRKGSRGMAPFISCSIIMNVSRNVRSLSPCKVVCSKALYTLCGELVIILLGCQLKYRIPDNSPGASAFKTQCPVFDLTYP